MHTTYIYTIIFISHLLTFLISYEVGAEVILRENYENGLDRWVTHGGCYPYSFTTIQDPCPKNNHNKVIRIINRMGEDNRNCTSSFGRKVKLPKGDRGYKHRAELMPKSKATRVRYNRSHWVGQRILIPQDWPKQQPADRMNISQIIPSFEGQRGTDLKFFIDRQQRWRVEIRTSAASRKYFDLGPIKRGQWTSWTFHYKRSRHNDGVAQIWRDGNRVLNYQGPTTYTEHSNGLWKHGIYLGLAENSKEYTIYVDDVTIAQGPNQLDAVSPPNNASHCADAQSTAPPQ